MRNLPSVELAIIGGSGLAQLEGLKTIVVIDPADLEGPFGQPAGPVIIGEIGGKRVAFQCRHGLGHQYCPTIVPFRAEIWALVLLGVRKAFAVSACGSLTEEILPGTLAVPSQSIDNTKVRNRTFFNRPGLAVHISLAKPFCEKARKELIEALHEASLPYADRGTYITIEGPGYSTDAEHDDYIRRGCHLIGMTTRPEADLAREAGICYAVLAMPTDIYTTGGHHQAVTGDMVIKTFNANIGKVKLVLPLVIENAKADDCACHHAVEPGIHSSQTQIPYVEQAILRTILRK